MRRVIYDMGESESVIMGSINPPSDAPFAGNIFNFMTKTIRKMDPIIKEGMETKAVVITITSLSQKLLRQRAASVPKKMPDTRAMRAAIMPI